MTILNKIHHREFEHTKVFDPQLLQRTGMTEEFFDVFGAIGWGEFWQFSEYPGSRLLTLEFMCTIKPAKNDIYFRLHNIDFTMGWEQFNCTTNIEHVPKKFNKREFWYETTGEQYLGKSQPRTSHFCNPTLRFMHTWMGVTLFPRDDVRIVREIHSRFLYAMVHKIRLSPVKAMVQHWITTPNRQGSFDFTFIITKFSNTLGILEGFNDYITTSRIVLKKTYFIQGHVIAGGPNETIEFKFRNTGARITLPCPELKLYGGHPLIPNLPGVGGRASFLGPYMKHPQFSTKGKYTEWRII
jgi:hypothetical protein